ncbi:uncharacterized protein LOC122289336 [Carya illinoinensis]|uniref:uncharacterized protein LOC122289336 n=1 Tax=Carya illinoinensis TaxID=32201 RepID=UPI001C722904|nr:uncharacterized protein LOC122289336 [Carya illinoinensis]
MEEDLAKLWNKLSLTKEERYELVITEQDVQVTTEKRKLCLVRKFIADKRVNRDAFKSTMMKWKATTSIRIFDVGENLFLFEFKSDKDMCKVWEGQPWMFDMNLLCLKMFDGLTPPAELSFTHTNLWVQFYNLPFGCMNKKVGTRIGNSIGRVTQVDSNGNGNFWGRFIRVLIEVDLMKPIARGKMMDLFGQLTFVQFKCKRLPRLCFKYGVIKYAKGGCVGHSSLESTGMAKTKQYGSWLRASSSGPNFEFAHNLGN